MKRLMMSVAAVLMAAVLLADGDSRLGNFNSIECKRTVKGDTVEVRFQCGWTRPNLCEDLGGGSLKIFMRRPGKKKDKRGRKCLEDGYYKVTMTAKKNGKREQELVVGKFEVKMENNQPFVIWSWTYTDEDKDHDLRRRDIKLKPSFEVLEITAQYNF